MQEKPDPQKNEDAEQSRSEEVFPGHYFDFFDLLDVRTFQQRTVVLNSRISEYTAGKLTRAFEVLSTSGSPSEPVTLLISSDGGDFYAGLAIIRAIQAAQARGCSVVGEVRGYAMSMAAIILQFCVGVEAKVLTADLRWVDAGSLRVGDRVISFDEYGGLPHGSTPRLRSRKWRIGTVQSISIEPKQTLLTELSDGAKVITTPDHLWLTRSRNGWTRTDSLLKGDRDPARVVKLFEPWTTPNNKEAAAYLAGLFDGEGTVGSRQGASFGNTDVNIVAHAMRLIDELGYPPKLGDAGLSPSGSGKLGFVVGFHGRMNERLRFLGQVRPVRLIQNAINNLSGIEMQDISRPMAVSISSPKTREVAVISTDTGTFVADGYAMHNCDLRFAALEDILMLHGATVSIGDTDIRGQKSELDLIEKKSEELSRFLAERNTADVPLSYWKGLFRDNHPHYFSGQEALEKGLIDRIL